MLLQSSSGSERLNAKRRAAPLGIALMAGVGAALVGAGAVLGLRHGPFVSLGESLLATLATCF